MAVPRASSMRSAFRCSTFRSSGPRVRSRFNQHIGRRTYASEHGSQKASSDLPWLIGSIVVTVPSAAWLWQQGPTKSVGHGHGDHEELAEHDEGGDEQPKDEAEEGEEKPKDDKKDDQEEGGDEDKKEAGGDDEAKPAAEDKDDSGDSSSEDANEKDKDTPPTSDDESGEDKPEKRAPEQINKPSGGKGAGETSKGTRPPTEKKGEKDLRSIVAVPQQLKLFPASNPRLLTSFQGPGGHSGAKHPYLDDPEKSKKAEGLTDTAKIHGTVSVDR